MEPKKPWQSRTVIIASILGIVSALSPFIPALGFVKTFIESNAVVIASLWGLLAVVLRFITKDKIQLFD